MEKESVLEWLIADRDYVAKYKDIIFRIHRDYKFHKPREFVVYKLQHRKEKNIDYKDLGYEFYMASHNDWENPRNVLRYSVDGEFWTEVEELIEKVEEILINNFLIEENDHKAM
ncbi:hypothetical protein [Paenibacillus sp. MMO-58]|uniref:hypothetical protein n=1 Tax=Paenibacillus sp. MMO-58 TaxID=3081290 RepID=UPI00301A0814